MRLTNTGAQLYLTTSRIALACHVLSWDEYLLRLQFVKNCAEPGTPEVRISAEILQEEEFGDEDEPALKDEWLTAEPERSGRGESSTDSKLSISNDDSVFEPPLLQFLAATSADLQNWIFHQGDQDFFPSIPHGHWKTDRRKKLHAYRGWIYQRDRQIGREPRWKIIELWNDEKFRSFATTSIQYYLTAFPKYVWPVRYPLRLPSRRRR